MYTAVVYSNVTDYGKDGVASLVSISVIFIAAIVTMVVRAASRGRLCGCVRGNLVQSLERNGLISISQYFSVCLYVL